MDDGHDPSDTDDRDLDRDAKNFLSKKCPKMAAYLHVRLVNHLRHTRSSMTEKRHKSPKTPPIIKAISGNFLSYGSGIFRI